MFVSGFRFSLVLCLALTATFFLASSPAFSPMQTSPQSTALTKDQLDAKDALDQGVAAFKNGQFDASDRSEQPLWDRRSCIYPLPNGRPAIQRRPV
jgi:hypothetical protein